VSLIDAYKKDYGKDRSPELFYYQILEDQNFRATLTNLEIAFDGIGIGFDGIKLHWRTLSFKNEDYKK